MRNTEKTKTWERTKTPGLLRHRTGRYYGRFTLAGKTKFIALKTDLLEVARTKFAEHRLRVEKSRKAARAAGTGSATMGDLLTLYKTRIEEKARPNPQTGKSIITPGTRDRYLQDVLFVEKTWPGFAKLQPGDVTRSAVERWRDHALTAGTGFRPPGSKDTAATKGCSPRCFNGGLAVVRRLLDEAVIAGFLSSNVLSVRGMRAKDTPRKPVLPETAKLLDIFAEIERGAPVGGWGKEMADFCRFLTFTGCRVSEAAAITWELVNLEKGIIHVPGTKTTAAKRDVPIIQDTRVLLERIRARREAAAEIAIDGKPYVDPASPVLRVKEAGRALARACEAVGVNRLVHHDLRDAFGTTCIEAGVPVPTVAGWMGHNDGGTLLLKTYHHHRPQHSREKAKLVSFGGAS